MVISKVENSAKQIQAAARMRAEWKDMIVNVKDYGAVGDGMTDDTAAIQRAINAVQQMGKAELWFPAGNYKVTELMNYDSISFIGDNASMLPYVTRGIGEFFKRNTTDNPLLGRFKTIKEDLQYNCWPVIIRTNTNRFIVFYGSGERHKLGTTYGRKLCYKYSDNDGLTWSDEQVVLSNPLYDYTTYGAIALSNGHILCFVNAYASGVTPDYYVMKSKDNGATFAEVFRFSQSADPHIRAVGFPNVPVEMDNGKLIASKNMSVSGKCGEAFIFSSDNGDTWDESVIAVPVTAPSFQDIPYEIRVAYIGGGKLIAMGRNDIGNLYQLISNDYGQTWSQHITNITDCTDGPAFPLYRQTDGTLTLYYTNRHSNTVNKRTVYAEDVFHDPSRWTDPVIIDYTSSPMTYIDGGYVTSVGLRANSKGTVSCLYTTRDIRTDDVTAKKTGVVIFFDNLDESTPPTKRNLIINGGFDVAQRGTSFSVAAGGQYTIDRWFSRRSSGSTGMSVSRVAGDLSRYAIRMQRSPGDSASDSLWIGQILETADVIPLRGKFISLTFRARCGADYSGDGGSFAVILSTGTTVDGSFTNSAGAIAGQIDIIDDPEAIATEWRTYRWTSTVPIGMNANIIRLRIRTATLTGTAGANDWVEIEQVQLSEGTIPVLFQQRPIAEEEVLCQRYCIAYSDVSATVTVGLGFAVSTTNAQVTIPLPAQMRQEPMLIATAGDWQLHDGATGIDVTAISLLSTRSSKQVVTLDCAVSSGLTQFRPYRLIADGTANRLLVFESEL